MNTAENCIIGFSGLVGSNILLNNKNIKFNHLFNTQNINKIENEYNIILFAGLPGTQWYANKNYREDIDNVNNLIEILKNVKCNQFILISTINVYPNSISKQTESVNLNIEDSIEYYGKHRLLFEKFVISNYKRFHIIRLPTIFGENMKKGVLFDLINKNYLNNICLDDEYQFYDLSKISKDIDNCIEKDIRILNLFSEPITVYELIESCFENYKIIDKYHIKYNDIIINLNERASKKFNICTNNFKTSYVYNKENSIEYIKNFLEKYALSHP